MSPDGPISRFSQEYNLYSEEETDRPRGMLTRDQRTVMTPEESKRATRSRQSPLLRQLSKGTFYSRSFERQFFNMVDVPRTNSLKVENDLNSEKRTLDECNVSQSKCRASVIGGKCSHPISPSEHSSIKYHHRRQHKRSRFGVPILSKLFEVVAALCVVGFSLECSGAPAMERPTTPRWVNPCGLIGNSNPNTDSPTPPDIEILSPILVTAKIALNQATSFKEEFVRQTFYREFQEHHEKMRSHRYDGWLPTREHIPKELGEELSKDYLQWFEGRMDDTMRNTFHYLQRFAVGFEQVVNDQRELRKSDEDTGLFVEKFAEVEGNLLLVLCELQTGMSMRKVQRPDDVDRDIMGPDYRKLLKDRTFRNLRDWIIYRDYINALEYIVQVLEHLVDTKASEQSRPSILS